MPDLTPEAAILTAAFSPGQATPAPAAPAPPPLAPGPPQGEITSAQAAQIVRDIRADLEKGKITPEEATRRFDSLGATPEQRAPDMRSDEVKQLDEHFPPARPQDFSIPYYTPGQAPPVMPKELQQFDQSARTWLTGAEFDRTLGNSLITEISRVAQRTKHMDANQLEQYGFDEFKKLTRVYGGEDKLQEKLQQAAVLIDALDKKQPGLKNLLRSKGIGDNALVVAQIIGQSERWHARRKGR